MPIVLYCPNLKCRSVVQVSDKSRGKKVRCGQCGTAFLVPRAASNTPPKPLPKTPADAPS